MRIISPVAALIVLWGTFVSLLPSRAADLAGLDETLAPAMRKLVAEQVISGAVALVETREGKTLVNSSGYADIANKKPMSPDTLFWIASMTKPITAVAVLMLQDEGKLNVEDAVEKYLPEFKKQWMVKEAGKEEKVLVPAPRPITIRDLLTHTSGMGDVPAPRTDCSLAELVMAYAQQPLRFPPGSKWEYCNPGINTLGRIVEVVSGKPFAEFLEKRVFRPVGMSETTFWPNASQAKRLAKSYKPAASGNGLEETDIYFVKGGLGDRHRTAFPAGGLFSTAPDMAKFYQMMLHQGSCHGKRLLSESAVHAMTHTQTGDIKTGFVEGMSWGLGFQVVKEPLGVNAGLSPGTFGHGGAYATQSWADPQRGLVLVLMIQRAGFPNGDNSPVRKVFQDTVGAAFK